MCEYSIEDYKKDLQSLKEKNWLDCKDIKNLLDNFINNKYINGKNQEEDICSIEECFKNNSSPKKQEELNLTESQIIFRAFSLFSLEQTRIVIIGKDPYPESGKAEGVSFSVQNSYKEIDDSLLNIFIAIENYKKLKKDKTESIDKGTIKTQYKKSLVTWAEKNQVLLLNTALTYQKKENVTKEEQEQCQRKHIKAWEPFFNIIIKNLLTSNNKKLVVFLWGDDAKTSFHRAIFDDRKSHKHNIIDDIRKDLLVLSTSHPTENRQSYKKGFCYEAPKHFAACDEFLFGKNKSKYTWLNFPENNE